MSPNSLVHIVDDEDSVRRSLDFLLMSADFRAKRWESGLQFLKHVDPTQRACVLMDIRMPDMDGLQVQLRMAEKGINLPVVMLSGHGDIALAVRAMKAGAVDFIEKPADRTRLLQAVQRAFQMKSDLDVLRRNTDWARVQVHGLTEREREVLDGLACGYPNKTIGYDLGISARTVEVYRANVMTKLAVASFADALRIAFAADLGNEKAWRESHGLAPQPNLTAAAPHST